MNDLGKGPTLEQACSALRDEVERVERILDVAERNSVIAGLPPFSEELRETLRRELRGESPQRPAPAG